MQSQTLADAGRIAVAAGVGVNERELHVSCAVDSYFERSLEFSHQVFVGNASVRRFDFRELPSFDQRLGNRGELTWSRAAVRSHVDRPGMALLERLTEDLSDFLFDFLRIAPGRIAELRRRMNLRTIGKRVLGARRGEVLVDPR